MRAVSGEALEEAIWEDLASFLQRPPHLRTLMESQKSASAAAYEEAQTRLLEVKKTLDGIAKKRFKAQTAFLEAEIGTPAEAKAHIESLDRQRAILEKERQELDASVC